MTDSYEYTVTSTNPSEYNFIRCSLEPPTSEYCTLTVNNITTKCAIVVLDTSDYIVINDTRFVFEDTYTDLNSLTFIDIFNELLDAFPVKVSIDFTNRLVFTGTVPFTITDASYNVQLLTGLYDTVLPVSSDVFKVIRIASVGHTLSTPVLYLVSNIGAVCFTICDRAGSSAAFQNTSERYGNQRILMRINNSFSSNQPIINSNTEFVSRVKSNDLCDVVLKLVDANMKDVRILSPMYISISAKAIPDATDASFEPA